MKPDYVEGQKATKNFEEGMKAIFKVPKAAIVQGKNRGKAASFRKPKKSDKD